jgi:hypothetical protein
MPDRSYESSEMTLRLARLTKDSPGIFHALFQFTERNGVQALTCA